MKFTINLFPRVWKNLRFLGLNIFEEIQKPNPDKKNLEKIEKNLRTEIGKLFEITGNRWKNQFNSENGEILKQKGYKILLEKGMIKILQNIFPEKAEYIE